MSRVIQAVLLDLNVTPLALDITPNVFVGILGSSNITLYIL